MILSNDPRSVKENEMNASITFPTHPSRHYPRYVRFYVQRLACTGIFRIAHSATSRDGRSLSKTCEVLSSRLQTLHSTSFCRGY